MPAQRAKSAKQNAFGTNSPPGEKWREGRCVGKEGQIKTDGRANQMRHGMKSLSRRVVKCSMKSGLDGAIIEEQR